MGSADHKTRVARVHPPIVRITHWLNAVAVIVMIGSGWRIYDNVPIFPWLTFPIPATLGGDPALTYQLNGDAGFSNALLWHFAFMWLLVVNGLVYVGYGLASGRFRRKLFPISPSEFVANVKEALSFKLSHEDLSTYNAVQKLLYLGVLAALTLIVVSGLAIWKPVQFQVLFVVFQDFQGARLVHFLCMSAIVLFLMVHVALAILVPRTIVSMVTGDVRVPTDSPVAVPAE